MTIDEANQELEAAARLLGIDFIHGCREGNHWGQPMVEGIGGYPWGRPVWLNDTTAKRKLVKYGGSGYMICNGRVSQYRKKCMRSIVEHAERVRKAREQAQ